MGSVGLQPEAITIVWSTRLPAARTAALVSFASTLPAAPAQQNPAQGLAVR
jgi:hypothetical protein